MGTLRQDIRYGLRMLARQPVQSMMIAGILAVGIAGTTTVFSLFNGVFLRPLPIPDQDRVMNLDEIDPATGNERLVPDCRFHAWRQYNQSFEAMAFSSQWVANVSRGGRAEHVGMRYVTHEFFDVFSVHPILGRTFTPEDDRVGIPLLAGRGFVESDNRRAWSSCSTTWAPPTRLRSPACQCS